MNYLETVLISLAVSIIVTNVALALKGRGEKKERPRHDIDLCGDE